MLETIIAILISLNIQFAINDKGGLNLSKEDFQTLSNNEDYRQFQSKENSNQTGYEGQTLEGIIIVPDIDPVLNK